MKLSILIPTLDTEYRKQKLAKLLTVLEPQLSSEVELVINSDRYEKTIGEKRNELLQQAQGEYTTFVDDDDLVSNDYVQKVLEAIESEPDCCGIQAAWYRPGKKNAILDFSLTTKKRTWEIIKGHCYRPFHHICPIRKEIAATESFLPSSLGEDQEWSKLVEKLLQTEVKIRGIIYHYYNNPHEMEEDYPSLLERMKQHGKVINHIRKPEKG